MTTTTPSNDEETLETTPAAWAAEEMGRTFAKEWQRIERGHQFWRRSVCGLVLCMLVAFTSLAFLFAEKMDRTVEAFAGIARDEQNKTELVQAVQKGLVDENLALRRELDVTTSRLQMSYRVHSQLRNSVANYLAGVEEVRGEDLPPAVVSMKSKLRRTLELVGVAEGLPQETASSSTD